MGLPTCGWWLYLSLLLLTGCGSGVRATPGDSPVTFSVSGKVSVGAVPIAGASVQMYFTSDKGVGSASIVASAGSTKSGQDGSYLLSGSVACPSPTSVAYLIAAGGQSALSSGQENKVSVLMSVAGLCTDVVNAQAKVQINEITSVGSIWPLAALISSPSGIGVDAAHQSAMPAALEQVLEFVDPASGNSPGPGLPAGFVAPTEKIAMLGALIASCAGSDGNVTSGDSVCSRLFQQTTYPGSNPPTDTFQAALAIAKHQNTNVNGTFQLLSEANPSAWSGTVAPTDWQLLILAAPLSSPAFLLSNGTYNGPQSVGIAARSDGATTYYTTDGTTPTSGASVYTSPFPVTQTSTVQALAMLGKAVSPVSSVTLKIVTHISVSPESVVLGPSDVMPFSATEAGQALNPVTWTISPAVGSISTTGVYTAPPNVSSAQTVTLTAVGATGNSIGQATIALQTTPSTLRAMAGTRGILVGAAADADELGQQSPLTHNPRYTNTLATQYNLLEPENAMKWAVIGANQGSYNFEPADQLVSFAQQHGMQVRGHNLCSYQQNPAWLSNLDSSQLYQALHDYIFTVLGHYKGQVFAWDVVNEAIAADASATNVDLNQGVWYKAPGIGLSGTGYVEQAFRWARDADPNAKLFYNDHGIEVLGNKQQALLTMLKDFQSRGVPIDGVGLQMHVDPTDTFPTTLPQALKSYTDLGLEVHITEMDVALPVDANGVASAADLQAQAATYRFVLNTCLQNARCTVFQTWGFSDEWSWIPQYFPGKGAALPFDKQYVAKPAFTSILQGLQSR